MPHDSNLRDIAAKAALDPIGLALAPWISALSLDADEARQSDHAGGVKR